jgi:hypothetical protein
MSFTHYVCLSQIRVSLCDSKGSNEMAKCHLCSPTSSIFVWNNYTNRSNGFITMEMCACYCFPSCLNGVSRTLSKNTISPLLSPFTYSQFHPKANSCHLEMLSPVLKHLPHILQIPGRKCVEFIRVLKICVLQSLCLCCFTPYGKI